MKNTSLWIRTAIIAVITLIGAYLVFGPRESFTANDFSWDGLKANLAKNINLGLDLKGGSHLVMRVKVDDYLKTLTTNNKDAALNVAKSSIAFSPSKPRKAPPRSLSQNLRDAAFFQVWIMAVT